MSRNQAIWTNENWNGHLNTFCLLLLVIFQINIMKIYFSVDLLPRDLNTLANLVNLILSWLSMMPMMSWTAPGLLILTSNLSLLSVIILFDINTITFWVLCSILTNNRYTLYPPKMSIYLLSELPYFRWTFLYTYTHSS